MPHDNPKRHAFLRYFLLESAPRLCYECLIHPADLMPLE